jgi:hypothetical protein
LSATSWISKPILNRLEIRFKRYLSGLDLSRIFLRRRVAEGAVRPFFVIAPLPSFDLIAGIIKAEEPVLVEALLPEPPIKRLDISVVCRLPRTREVQRDMVPVSPKIDVLGDKFRPVVHPNRPRPSVILHDPLQDLDHLAAPDPLAHVDSQTFTGMIVDYRQKPDPTPIEELVRHKIHAPTLVLFRSQWPQFPLQAGLAPPGRTSPHG